MSDPDDPMHAVREAATWPQLQKAVAAWAQQRSVDPKAALAELAGPGALSALLCAEAHVVRPINKGGRPKNAARERIVLIVVDALKAEGMKGAALWKRAHREIATKDSLMGIWENVEPSAIQRAYLRANRKRLADKTSLGKIGRRTTDRG